MKNTSRLSGFIIAAMICLVLTAANITALRLVPAFLDRSEKSVMGGELESELYTEPDNIKKDYIKPDNQYIERFLRPSELKPVEKLYFFDSNNDIAGAVFKKPSEVVRAYFDILSDASNMEGKKGGCGSIGYEKAPYPEAYKLLSDEFKKTMPYEKFVKSFEGIGHINLLKVADAPSVKIDGVVYPKSFVEIETIEGSDMAGKTYFGYYYGFATVSKDSTSGWKIQSIELKPEDFLCHAYHGWWHDAGTMVDTIYIKKHGVIEKILGVEEDGFYRNVLAKGKDGRQYRIMFIRLTNGADLELRQYVMEDNRWKDIRIDIPPLQK